MTTKTRHALIGVAAAGAASILALTAVAQPMSSPDNSPATRPPAFPTSSTPAPQPDADSQQVLTAVTAMGLKPIEKLTPAEARKQPTFADGVTAVMKQRHMSTAPDPSVTTTDMSYGSNPWQKARIYRPAGSKGHGAMPVVVYYHGGGWVIADLKVYDATPRLLAKQLNAIVVSVEYRHAPEFKFPAQHEDAAAAYGWVAQNAAKWGGDPGRIALAGESAGGNLAVATAIYARDNGLPAPVHILSVYPIANSDMNLPSKREEANAKPLNKAMLGWFGFYYTRSPADQQDPRLNLVAANLRGLPPTTIVNAQLDPLRSDGETLAEAMRRAGVQVEQRTFPGVTHEFFGGGKAIATAKQAEDYAISRLQPALGGR